MRLQDGCFLLNFATLSQTPILNQIHQADSAGEYLRSTSNINRSHYLRNSYSCICHKGLYLNVKAAIAIPLLTSSPSCNHYSKHIHAAMGTNFIILLTSVLVSIKQTIASRVKHVTIALRVKDSFKTLSLFRCNHPVMLIQISKTLRLY